MHLEDCLLNIINFDLFKGEGASTPPPPHSQELKTLLTNCYLNGWKRILNHLHDQGLLTENIILDTIDIYGMNIHHLPPQTVTEKILLKTCRGTYPSYLLKFWHLITPELALQIFRINSNTLKYLPLDKLQKEDVVARISVLTITERNVLEKYSVKDLAYYYSKYLDETLRNHEHITFEDFLLTSSPNQSYY